MEEQVIGWKNEFNDIIENDLIFTTPNPQSTHHKLKSHNCRAPVDARKVRISPLVINEF